MPFASDTLQLQMVFLSLKSQQTLQCEKFSIQSPHLLALAASEYLACGTDIDALKKNDLRGPQEHTSQELYPYWQMLKLPILFVHNHPNEASNYCLLTAKKSGKFAQFNL